MVLEPSNISIYFLHIFEGSNTIPDYFKNILMDFKIPILAFDKAVFSTPEIYQNILKIIWGGIRTFKYM